MSKKTDTVAPKVLKMPVEVEIELANEYLRSGAEVKLRAKGTSMHPVLHHLTDNLILVAADPGNLKRGDIVLANVLQHSMGRSTRKYVVHRITHIHPSEVVLRGDNCYGVWETCRPEKVTGRLVAIERDGRRISVLTRRWKIREFCLRSLYRSYRHCRRMAGQALRALHLKN